VEDFLKNILTEDTGLSIKRSTSLIAFGLICLTVLVNLFFKLTLDTYLADILFYVYVSGLSLGSIEKIFRPSRLAKRSTKKIAIEESEVTDKE